jgi:hypothetical protein
MSVLLIKNRSTLVGGRLRRLTPLAGRKRQKAGSAATKAEGRHLETRLISKVGAGQHGGAAGKTSGDMVRVYPPGVDGIFALIRGKLRVSPRWRRWRCAPTDLCSVTSRAASATLGSRPCRVWGR